MRPAATLLLAAGLLAAAPARAACPTQPPDLTVCPAGTCDHLDIASAIGAANPGDVVCVEPGTYTQSLTVGSGDQVVIESAQGPASTFISTGSGGEIVHVNGGGELELVGFTIVGTSSRRAVRVDQAGSTLILDDMVISGFSSNDDAPAIRVESGTTLELYNSVLADNATTQNDKNGAHIYATGASITVADTDFLRGSMEDSGGVEIDNTTALFERCRFEDNLATEEDGGGIRATGGSLTVIDTTFLNNDADQHGGAISAVGTTVVVAGSTFTGNRADYNGSDTGYGGAIRMFDGSLTVSDSTFEANSADDGGAIDVRGSGLVDILRGHFCLNDADTYGGGVKVDGQDTTVENSTFVENTCGDHGGGFKIDNADASLVNNTFLGNACGNDPEGAHYWNATGDIRNNLFGAHTDRAFDAAGGSSVTVDFNAWVSNGDDIAAPGKGTNHLTTASAGLVAYTRDGDCSNDDLTPDYGLPSLLIDRGDTNAAYDDPDGTRNDIGAYGGPGSPLRDDDSDGYLTGADCDDTDSTVNPGAVEVENDGVDQDCDGLELCYEDGDGDGYGTGTLVGAPELDCVGADVSPLATDCDDNAASAFPGGTPVVADGVDNDCAGGEECYLDGDGDGFGGSTLMDDPDLDCTDDAGQSDAATDCDDTVAAAHPGGAETTGDEIDGDCDGGEICFDDADRDGYGTALTRVSGDVDCDDNFESTRSDDCDDGDDTIHPGAVDTPADGFDTNCSGGDACYADNDGDNYGSTTITDAGTDLDCADLGEAGIDTDCDNSNPNVNPGEVEVVDDGIDQDCADGDACYDDKDGDGHAGNLLPYMVSTDLDCADPGEFTVADDCDDNDPSRYPSAIDVPADGIDNDCNGFESCFQDLDGDGQGSNVIVDATDQDCIGTDLTDNNDDCDDTDDTIYLYATEIVADGVDQDCDSSEECWLDFDRDGYGHPTVTELSTDLSCQDPGVSADNTDCDDNAGTTFPGATEVVADEIDQDCDGREICFADSDLDGYGDVPNGAPGSDTDCDDLGESIYDTDCDDGDAGKNPDATDAPNDGDDRDCDGFELCPLDIDLDGYGRTTTALSSAIDCVAPGFSDNTSDCDDDDDTFYPGAPEIQDDGFDQDCNGTDTKTCYQDLDGDSYGTTVEILAADGRCDLAQDESQYATDCDDTATSVHPGAPETKNDGIDQDCDGADLEDCYDDDDDDGHGAVPPVLVEFEGDCGPEPGMADSADDCDDTDATVYPGAPDVCGDNIDSDCNGQLDDDGDGLTWPEELALGLDDCIADVDGDTLLDGAEVAFGTDPADADSDGDTVSDDQDGPPPVDSDLDGFIDALDDDDDDDTVPTSVEEGIAGADRLDDDDDDDTLLTHLEDVDGDGTPTNDDTDGDGLHNWLDDDDDDDGLSTSVEIAYGADHLSIDTDGDTILDGVEWGGGAVPRDSEQCPPYYTTPCPDGTPDLLDDDDDNDGIPTAIEGDGDYDTDGTPNYLDPDADGDLTYDIDEYKAPNWLQDDDGDGAPNFLDDNDSDGGTGDPDRDTLLTADEQQIGSLPFDPDTDSDGVHDGDEAPNAAAPMDTDGDTDPDIFDGDDDGDGIPTLEETGLLCSDGLPSFDIEGNTQGLLWVCPDGEQLDPIYRDTDGDTVPDYLDPDDDGDGTPTLDEGQDDGDGDGVPNWLDELDRDGPLGDADGDSIINQDEVAQGTDPYDPDSDSDGLLDPDEVGDSDGDGLVDALDPDDDDDGVPTLEEGTVDTDGDGLSDHLDDDSDGDGRTDAEEAGLDDDCDLRPDRVDPDDRGPCEDSAPPVRGTYTRQGCACDGSTGGGAGWLVLGLAAALGLRRRAA